MKKGLLFAFSLMLCNVAFGVNRVQVVLNYTNGIYNGSTYSKIVMTEDDFIKDKGRYEGRFFDGVSETYPGIAYFPDTINPSEPVVYVDILQVSNKGNVVAEVSYEDRKEMLKGKGGVFGSFLNLFGDGMCSLGKVIGQWLSL